ncbi:unnamed protein product [Ectocarpus sp. CCAP 1310/34]|nr:unnamed protein product [Ectocarpus sp. CCAP 1310/34]
MQYRRQDAGRLRGHDSRGCTDAHRDAGGDGNRKDRGGSHQNAGGEARGSHETTRRSYFGPSSRQVKRFLETKDTSGPSSYRRLFKLLADEWEPKGFNRGIDKLQGFGVPNGTPCSKFVSKYKALAISELASHRAFADLRMVQRALRDALLEQYPNVLSSLPLKDKILHNVVLSDQDELWDFIFGGSTKTFARLQWRPLFYHRHFWVFIGAYTSHDHDRGAAAAATAVAAAAIRMIAGTTISRRASCLVVWARGRQNFGCLADAHPDVYAPRRHGFGYSHVSAAPGGLVNHAEAQGPSGQPQARHGGSSTLVPTAPPPDPLRRSPTERQRRTVLTAPPLPSASDGFPKSEVSCSLSRDSGPEPPAAAGHVGRTPAMKAAFNEQTDADVLRENARVDRLVSHDSAAGSPLLPASPRNSQSGPPSGGTQIVLPVAGAISLDDIFSGKVSAPARQAPVFDGIQEYYNDEFMMAEKARIFGDDAAYAKIMATSDPREHKSLGRKVRRFDHALWELRREDVVFPLLYAKFAQNADACERLLATGDRQIAEASPYDGLWGIGVDAFDPRAASPSKWTGRNLLGKALVATRTLLRVRPVEPDKPLRPEHSGQSAPVCPTIHEIASPGEDSSADDPPSEDARGLLGVPANTPSDHSKQVLDIASAAFREAAASPPPLLAEHGPDLVSGYAELEPGYVLGVATAPLVQIPLASMDPTPQTAEGVGSNDLRCRPVPKMGRRLALNHLVGKKVDAILDQYLAAGLIQHSQSPWASPLVVMPKKDGNLRLTVNYKKRNKLCSLGQQPQPRVDHIIDSLHKGIVFSIFDLNSAFHQITVDEDTVQLTTFCTPTQLFEWLRMPHGSSVAPSWFTMVINEVVKGLDHVLAYLDDVIVFDADPVHHVANIRLFLERLRKYNLKLSPLKSHVGAKEAVYLGHTISPAGACPRADKVEALTKMLLPNNVKQLRSLLGGLSYYRKSIKGLAVRVKPLTDLLRKDAKFCFTPAMADTVKGLLAKLTEPPVLAFPDWDAVADGSRPLRLCCDACVDGFGEALEQEQADGFVRPILFVSRATLESERNWTVLDLEAGRIVWAIKRLRGYFWSTHFLIYSDRKALESIVKVGEHNARVQRWLEFLSSFNYTLVYRKGTANANADFVSWLPLPATKAGRHGDTSIAVDDVAGDAAASSNAGPVERCREIYESRG